MGNALQVESSQKEKIGMMKAPCILIFLLLVITAFRFPVRKEVNLDKTNTKKRIEYLTKISEKVIKRYGPDYYRDLKPPVIRRIIVGQKNDTVSSGRMRSEHKGRAYYEVKYFHDPSYEYMHTGYAAKIVFWADTGIPESVIFGNGFGMSNINEKGLYDNKKRIMPYKWKAPRKKKSE